MSRLQAPVPCRLPGTLTLRLVRGVLDPVQGLARRWSGRSWCLRGMGVVAGGDRISGAQRVSRLGWDLVASKVRRPPVRPGTVRRSLLVERLRAGASCPIVSVVAPPGYGKTTL